MKNKFAVTIVLYRPEKSMALENLNQVLRAGASDIFLIDNTEGEKKNNDLISVCPEIVHYFSYGVNVGIAKALNKGISLAEEKGYEWVLTLDQDSFVPLNMFEVYDTYLQSCCINVAMLSCNIDVANKYTDNQMFSENVLYPITSGSLTNIEAWREVGMFDEKLFIDGVDHDFSIRLRNSGYKLIKFSNLFLKHTIGSPRSIYVMGKEICTGLSHNPARIYYMCRNYSVLRKRYIEEADSGELDFPMLAVLRIILLFETHKIKYLVSLIMGYSDYKHLIFRSYDEMMDSTVVLRWINKHF